MKLVEPNALVLFANAFTPRLLELNAITMLVLPRELTNKKTRMKMNTKVV